MPPAAAAESAVGTAAKEPAAVVERTSKAARKPEAAALQPEADVPQPPRKQPKQLVNRNAAIKLSADFFSDM